MVEGVGAVDAVVLGDALAEVAVVVAGGGTTVLSHAFSSGCRCARLRSGFMWSDIGTLLIGLLGVAVGANWLSTDEARRLANIRTHAELLPLLPEGKVRDEFAAEIDWLTWVHLRTTGGGDVAHWSRLRTLVLQLFIFTWLPGLALTVWGLLADPVPEWAGPFTLGLGLLSAGLAVLSMAVLRRRTAAIMATSSAWQATRDQAQPTG